MNEHSIIENANSNTSGKAVLETDSQFFDALMQSDVGTLGRILSDDFIVIDVMRGAETTKPEFIGAIGSGIVQFEKIEIRDNRVRLYHRTAVITGQSRITVRFSETLSSISSRYTHVYCELDGKWCLVSAQGTPIQQQ